ncbi:MAG: hypothetical protein ACYDAK_06935 [Candidatus Limnocylindrales bacterium]
MDPNSRYIVAQARMSERFAEAQRARLVKGDSIDGNSVDRHAGAMARARSRIVAPVARLLTVRVRLAARRPALILPSAGAPSPAR